MVCANAIALVHSPTRQRNGSQMHARCTPLMPRRMALNSRTSRPKRRASMRGAARIVRNDRAELLAIDPVVLHFARLLRGFVERCQRACPPAERILVVDADAEAFATAARSIRR